MKKKVKKKKKMTVRKKIKKVKKKPAKKIKAAPRKNIKAKAKTAPAIKAVKEKAPVKPIPQKFKPKKAGPQQVFIGLGSNVGDREEYIEQAIALLKETKGIKVVRRSSNYETKPEGKKAQPLFINSVVEISTAIEPMKLLELTQSFEDTLGRERGVEWGPRTIDIDILLYGDELISEDDLTIPHPLMHERLFVLEPLVEIAPLVMHPILERTMKELYNDKKIEAGEKYEDEMAGFRELKKGIAEDYEHW